MSVKSYGGVSSAAGSGTSPPLSNAPSTLTEVSSGSHGYLGGRYPSHGGQAWWSVGDFLRQGVTHQSVGLTLAQGGEEDLWDLSDSLADLRYQVNAQDQAQQGDQSASGSTKTLDSAASSRKVDVKSWIEQDTSHGFIRVFNPDTDRNSKLFPCTLYTTAQKICLQMTPPSTSLHIQLNGDIIRRLEPFDCPLAIQSECLTSLGFSNVRRVQEEGALEDLQYLIKFYSGKPVSDSTYSRNQLTSYAYVRKGKLLHQWVRRYCVISGTRLLIYRDKNSKPTVVQLAKGSVEEVQVKGQEHVLKLTSTLQGERAIYISLSSESDYSRWLKKAKKATSKLPTKADLSNCHLEFLPETVFINDDLQTLVLRHNALKERPIEEDIYTIGWLDDLPRFTHLRNLNLADNNLQTFPLSVCRIPSLVELNMASNKLEEIPPQISELTQLQSLHVHNNHLTTLPEEIVRMRNLRVIVLAFNRFTTVPGALVQNQNAIFQIDSIIMAGNQIERLPTDYLGRMAHIKKIDLRLNRLQLLPTETAKFGSLEHITHLDIRDNAVVDLDIRAIRALEYLNCERNGMQSLQVNGASLKNLLAAHNNLETLSINPKPEWIVNMDVSHNKLAELPPFLGDCFFLVRLDVSHNQLVSLPDKLLSDTRKLKVFKANHNRLTRLPSDIQHSVLEEMHVQHNQLKELPPDLFIRVQRLRYLNATKNELKDLPAPNRNETYNKLHELYLTANRLTSRVVAKINCFPRLRILHLAGNRITELDDSDFESLENLVELNVSSNNLTELPWSLGRHPKLQVLRANSNLVQEIPSFKNSSCLKVLEVGNNRLMNVSMTNLMSSQVNLLDISGNPNLSVNTHNLEKHAKRVCMVDMRGQSRSIQDLSRSDVSLPDLPWQSGFSQTSGIRNKLSVAILNRPRFSESGEALFGVVDGGRNDEVVKTLADMLPGLVQNELKHSVTRDSYLKYSLLSAHRKLKALGQRVGASAAVVHIAPSDSPGQYTLSVANVGDAEVVLCRQGKPLCLTRAFAVSKDNEECHRIIKSDGIITEDGRVNGVTYNTRLLGSSFLFPQVIPSPHVTNVTLTSEDQVLVVGSHGLWKFLSHQEALDEVLDIPDPVIAAKRLQDLAQAYGSKENVGVLVVRLLLSKGERERMSALLAKHREGQRSLLAMLAAKTEILQMQDGVGGAELEGIVMDKAGRVKKPRPSTDRPSLSVKPLPAHRYRKKDAPENWEAIMQRRLQEEVKTRELQMEVPTEGASGGQRDGTDSNWSTLTRSDNVNSNSKARKAQSSQLPGRNPTLPLPPPPPLTPPPLPTYSRKTSGASLPLPPPPPPLPPMHYRSNSSDSIMSFDDFCKQPLIQNNVDRDAILFHKMQIAARAHSSSTSSMDSSKSDPLYASVRDMYDFGPKASSRSIEVLIHAPPSQERRVPPPPPPPPPPPSSSQGARGGRHQRDLSESGEYTQRFQDESEMYALETEVLEDFQVSIDEMYATVMKKKPDEDAGDEKGDDDKDDADNDDDDDDENKDRRGRQRRDADDDDNEESDYMTVGEVHRVPDSALYRCLVDSQSLTSINDTTAEGDNSSVTESPAGSPVASPVGSPGQQRVSRTPSEASVIITYL